MSPDDPTIDDPLHTDPIKPPAKIKSVRTQINQWSRLYPGLIDGIYLDVGPTQCVDAAVSGTEGVSVNSAIPGVYRSYVAHIRELGYQVFILAPQYPDNVPGNDWLRQLDADYLGLWEEGMVEYKDAYGAIGYCVKEKTVLSAASLPDNWWRPWFFSRKRHVHIINDCPDARQMRMIAEMAINRYAWTVWITAAAETPEGISVYDQLPDYWDEEVEFFKNYKVPTWKALWN